MQYHRDKLFIADGNIVNLYLEEISVHDRLLLLRKFIFNLTQRKFSYDIGETMLIARPSSSKISKLERGHSRNIPMEVLEFYSKIGVNMNWIMSGTGKIIIGEMNERTKLRVEFVRLGYPAIFTSYYLIDDHKFENEWIDHVRIFLPHYIPNLMHHFDSFFADRKNLFTNLIRIEDENLYGRRSI